MKKEYVRVNKLGDEGKLNCENFCWIRIKDIQFISEEDGFCLIYLKNCDEEFTVFDMEAKDFIDYIKQ
jgi:hypothetical protein